MRTLNTGAETPTGHMVLFALYVVLSAGVVAVFAWPVLLGAAAVYAGHCIGRRLRGETGKSPE